MNQNKSLLDWIHEPYSPSSIFPNVTSSMSPGLGIGGGAGLSDSGAGTASGPITESDAIVAICGGSSVWDVASGDTFSTLPGSEGAGVAC